MVERDGSADMIDSTVVRAHHCAVGLKRGIRRPRASAAHAVVLLVVVGWGCGAKGHKGHAYSCVRAGARARTGAQPWAGGMIGDGRRERASPKAKGNGACRLGWRRRRFARSANPRDAASPAGGAWAFRPRTRPTTAGFARNFPGSGYGSSADSCGFAARPWIDTIFSIFTHASCRSADRLQTCNAT
jgi:hypothetical protein